MLHANDLAELPQLPEPVLTAYLDTDPANPRNQGRKGPATWLRSEAKTLSEAWGPETRAACLEQAQRVSDFLIDKRAGGSRSLVVFAGPKAWRLLPLQVRVDEEVHWGTPALGQLLWLLDEYQPCGVVTVSRAGARFYRYHMGEVEEDPAQPMQLDTSQWRERSLVMGVGVEQDLFERRAAAQYQRFYEQVAAHCQAWSKQERLTPVLLMGDSKSVEAVRAAMPEAYANDVLSESVLPSYETESQIVARAEPLIEAWKRQRERDDVARLLDNRTRPGVVTGVDATLAALQEGRVRELVVVRGLRGRLRQCPGCGWVDRTATAACPHCSVERPMVSPRAVLPQLARRHATAVEIVSGEAADQLAQDAEGLAGWLRAA